MNRLSQEVKSGVKNYFSNSGVMFIDNINDSQYGFFDREFARYKANVF